MSNSPLNIEFTNVQSDNLLTLTSSEIPYNITLSDDDGNNVSVSLSSVENIINVEVNSIENNNTIKFADSDAWKYAEECRQIKNDISTTLDNIQEAGNIKITRNNNSLIIGTKSYLHEQNEPSDIWYIEHNLDKLYVQIRVIDSAGNSYYPAYDFIDKNSCYVYLDGNTTGKAYVE